MRFIVRIPFRLALATAFLAAATAPVLAQPAGSANQTTSINSSTTLSQAQINDIIRKFAAKETEFRQALNQYAFKRDALVQVLGMGGQVTGEYHRVSDFTFDDSGNRFEKINYFPMPSFGGVTQEDLEDLGGVNPFALEARKLSEYDFKYVGKERIDELDLYVFDVAPKITPDAKKTKERFFIGRIWVDDHDLQIVKSKGKAIPETKDNKFPIVETYREQIDGKYWFPTYAYADDDLIYDNGSDLRIRMRVKYTDFKVGRGKVTITEVSEAPEQIVEKPVSAPKAEARPTPAPARPSTITTTPADAGEMNFRDAGILNDRATDLPQPVYPAEAKKARVSGQVQVKVFLDETGKVLSAEAMWGPDALQAAAVAAAKRARFNPILIDGVPWKVFGILTYDFTAQ
jgi:TonB family protein